MNHALHSASALGVRFSTAVPWPVMLAFILCGCGLYAVLIWIFSQTPKRRGFSALITAAIPEDAFLCKQSVEIFLFPDRARQQALGIGRERRRGGKNSRANESQKIV